MILCLLIYGALCCSISTDSLSRWRRGCDRAWSQDQLEGVQLLDVKYSSAPAPLAVASSFDRQRGNSLCELQAATALLSCTSYASCSVYRTTNEVYPGVQVVCLPIVVQGTGFQGPKQVPWHWVNLHSKTASSFGKHNLLAQHAQP